MLRNGGLCAFEPFDKIADRSLLECEQGENLAPPGFGHSIEHV
jgi:hypothetical protein